jgi:hypothetical protein
MLRHIIETIDNTNRNKAANDKDTSYIYTPFSTNDADILYIMQWTYFIKSDGHKKGFKRYKETVSKDYSDYGNTV